MLRANPPLLLPNCPPRPLTARTITLVLSTLAPLVAAGATLALESGGMRLDSLVSRNTGIRLWPTQHNRRCI